MAGKFHDSGLLPQPVDEALRKFIEVHLQSEGVSLTAEQIQRLSQQDPVRTFLRGMLDGARREQNGDAESISLDETPNAPQGAAVLSRPAAAPEYERWRPPSLDDLPQLQVPKLEVPAAIAEMFASAPTPAPVPMQAPVAAPQAQPQPVAPPPAPPVPTPVPAPVAQDPGPVAETGVQHLSIRLPNATAMALYSYTFMLYTKPELAQYKIIAVEGLEGYGLEFAPEGRLHGSPTTDRTQTTELKFTATLERSDGQQRVHRKVTLTLLVNPDPRALWKQIEPDAALPFQKPHRRCGSHQLGGLRCVAASVRGRSHANSGTFREDDFYIDQDPSGQWLVIAVSDGAGSAKLSRRGSELATQKSATTLCEALPGVEEKFVAAMSADWSAVSDPAGLQKTLDNLFLEPLGRSAHAASKAIVAESKQLKVEEKALSATLLLAAVREHAAGIVVVSYWIGDGAAAAYDPSSGNALLLGEADAGEFSGQTRFLLSSEFGTEAWTSIKKRVRVAIYPKGSALVLMSDGVSDPKFGTDKNLHDSACWKKWWDDMSAEVNIAPDHAGAPEAMQTYLEFWSQGEHDDRTLALVLNGTTN